MPLYTKFYENFCALNMTVSHTEKPHNKQDDFIYFHKQGFALRKMFVHSFFCNTSVYSCFRQSDFF